MSGDKAAHFAKGGESFNEQMGANTDVSGFHKQMAELSPKESLVKPQAAPMNDGFKLVGDDHAAARQAAKKAADIPYRYIEGAGNGGKVPEKSQHALREERREKGVPIQEQADGPINRIKEAAKFEKPKEVTAKEGDSYWSIARSLISEQNGKPGTAGEVKTMMQKLAAFNNKTEVEAGKLNIGDKVKVPPKDYKLS